MPKETHKDNFPPSKFYLDEDFLGEVVVYDLIECLKQFARDATTDDFTAVYEGFDFPAIVEFIRWRAGGASSLEKELGELSVWYHEVFNG